MTRRYFDCTVTMSTRQDWNHHTSHEEPPTPPASPISPPQAPPPNINSRIPLPTSVRSTPVRSAAAGSAPSSGMHPVVIVSPTTILRPQPKRATTATPTKTTHNKVIRATSTTTPTTASTVARATPAAVVSSIPTIASSSARAIAPRDNNHATVTATRSSIDLGPQLQLIVHALDDLETLLQEHRADAAAFAMEMQGIVTDILLTQGGSACEYSAATATATRSGSGNGSGNGSGSGSATETGVLGTEAAVAAAVVMDGWFGLNEAKVGEIGVASERLARHVAYLRMMHVGGKV